MTDRTPGPRPTRPAILVVEDEPALARALLRTLDDGAVDVHHARTTSEALALHGRHAPGARGPDGAGRLEEGCGIVVVVTDVGLPDGDGLDLVGRLRAVDPSLGAVVTTGLDDGDVADRAVALGVQGFLHKPFGLAEVRVNVANARAWRIADRAARADRAVLEAEVASRTEQLRHSRAETIRRLALAAEARDGETGAHLERMSRCSEVLARRAGLDRETCETIRVAAPMHDVGKIAIADEILRFDGTFDAAQRAAMAEHTRIGWEILAGSGSPLLEVAAGIARWHHEWWDGTGYPDGLAGRAIPLEARIVALADVWDALRSARRYKPAFDVDRAVSLVRAERGTHFDPELVDLLLADVDELEAIRALHADDGLALAR